MNHVGQGGAALALYDLISEIQNSYYNKYEMFVVTGKYNELNHMLNNLRIPNATAPFHNFLSTYKKPRWFWRNLIILRYWFLRPLAIKKIERMIDFAQVNIIHSNLNRIDIGAYFAKKYNIPHVWHIRENATGGFKLMSVYGNPVKHMLNYNSVFVTISQSVTRNWIAYGLPEKMISMIYDGIRTEAYCGLKPHIFNDVCKFVFLGGYAEFKGQFRFVKALSKLPNSYKEKIRVDFFGNGDSQYINEIAIYVRKYKLDNIVCLKGYDHEIYKKLNSYHVGVNCSRNEGFGRITVEYMMAGLCPLVSNSGANLEVVVKDESGIVYNIESEIDLIKKIEYIIDNKESIYKMSLCAQKRSLEQFSMRTHARNIIKIYEELADKRI